MNVIYLVISLCAAGNCDPVIQTFMEPDEVIHELTKSDRVKVYRLTCNDHNCLVGTIYNKPEQKSLEQLSDEAVKKTNAEFCKKATEPWQVKAFCK